MLHRTLIVAIIWVAAGAPCQALNLDAQLFPLNGEIRLSNSSASAVPLAYCSIKSPSGALNGSILVWKSISDTYDASGNGLIDPSNNWTKLSTASTELTEGVFTGPGGSLPGFRTISLGQIWNPALYPLPDLAFDVRQPDSTPITMTIQFKVAGDYNSSGSVTALDYTTWRQTFGSTTLLGADGNLNGIVDGADYAVWRNNLGLSLPGAGSSIAGGASLHTGFAIPEPGVATIVLAGLLVTAIARAPRAARRGVLRSSAHR
jgi:hypothetical protein